MRGVKDVTQIWSTLCVRAGERALSSSTAATSPSPRIRKSLTGQFMFLHVE